jgi:choline dehydrogenase-like flavoprotein
VLDSRLRVHGVPRLRVVDASIFPRIPGYFIVSAIYMAAEKAADMILEDSVPITAAMEKAE